VVITGGLGFIGSSIAARLAADGHRVTVIDNLSTSVLETVSGAEVLRLDLADTDAVAGLTMTAADCLIHLAGPSSGMESSADPVRTIAGGYGITLNALKLAKRLHARRVLNASSMTVYGNPAGNPVGEDTACLPISHYGVGKYANERLVEMFCKEAGIRFNQLRFFNVYGPGQDLRRMGQGLVSIFLALLMKSPKVTSKGSLKRFRDIVHIEDVVEVCVRCASDDIVDGPLNVGSGEAIVYEDLIRVIADELGILDRLEIVVEDGTSGDQFGIYADIRKLKAELDFTPKFAPEPGVRDFTRWAREKASALAAK